MFFAKNYTSRWLCHVNYLGESAIKKRYNNIHLEELPSVMNSYRDEVVNRLASNSGSKGFLEVNAMNLFIALGHDTSFVDRR